MSDRTIYAESPEAAARVRALLASHDDPYWHAGSAEPWIAALLQALVSASDPTHAIEIGGFEGYTSQKLAYALDTLPHDSALTVCEIDERRARDIDFLLAHTNAPRVRRTVVCADSLAWIPTLPDRSIDFVWLDGNHEKEHVAQEIGLLWPKLAPGALLCGHDVYGVCDLVEVFDRARATFGAQGISLNLPRLGPAGGLGIIQRPL